MGTVTTLPGGRAYTRADLDAMPDDGHRYELIDGTLVVTPAPSRRHQLASSRLHEILTHACPPDHVVLSAPVDLTLAEGTVVRPDLLVVPLTQLADDAGPLEPLLVVEIASPSTRLVDRELKRARYEDAGIPSYWLVDSESPTLIAWELRDDRYVVAADVRGGEAFSAERPFAVDVAPEFLTSTAPRSAQRRDA